MAQKQKDSKTKDTQVADDSLNYHEVEVVCACGAKYTVGSTYDGDTVHVDLCSKCHPFYTGEQKIVDTENLVAKFEKKAEKAQTATKSRAEKRSERRAKRSKVAAATASEDKKELTLKDIMKALENDGK